MYVLILNVRVGKLTMTRVDVLQGSHDVEKPLSSKFATTVGGDNEWSPIRDGV